MLKKLSINNLAIIENAEISFKKGFTVLTGPTGAGKSLVIDSLSLLLGERASTELIRSGEDKATLIGEFEIRSPRLEALLNELGITCIDKSLVIERIISKSKAVIKANGVVISLNDLNKISKYLADIHSQFDFAKILNKDNYLGIIDGYAGDATLPYKENYQSSLYAYREKEKELDELLLKKKKLDENRDFYSFQFEELKNAGLEKGEEETINEELGLLKNYDKVYSLANEADSLIREDFLDKLYELDKLLFKLGDFQSSYQKAHEEVEAKYYELDDIFNDLKKGFKSIDYDPERLNVLQQREYDLNSLKRKYKKSIDELIAYRDELASLLNVDNDIDKQIEDKTKEKDAALSLCLSKGKDLSMVRHRIARDIEKELKTNLSDLLLRANFEIEFIELDSPKETGLDEVNFLIETNIGEGLKNLEKTISGGEASRIMLAFKAIFLKSNKIETAVFDEIDTGISGEAAMAVARKIKEISLSRQVIAITHMPQVASLSDNHILILKNIKNGRTFTSIKDLSLDEKIKEVANLISGGKITDKQLEYAKEMVLSNI